MSQGIRGSRGNPYDVGRPSLRIYGKKEGRSRIECGTGCKPSDKTLLEDE